eukprot:TRINITY_DN4748_c0_g1_i1.p1 TRINITY_DN4748_c0_g1~~TRINITY_DN4748_c0_g1_i1.p1  ORF type:complete len:58 (-),score=6.38 TRINITY_DN4748_c0_g1_i1:30-203(-)
MSAPDYGGFNKGSSKMESTFGGKEDHKLEDLFKEELLDCFYLISQSSIDFISRVSSN